MPTKLILIRHGETKWNRQKRYCGFKDLGLSSRGRGQAKKLHKRLKGQEVSRIYSSDRKRAIETAKIIFRETKIQKVAGLREVHFGVFEGLTHKQVMQKHAAIYKKWLSDPFSITIPRGEKLADFKCRVIKAITRIIRLNKNKTVAVICHGGAISIFMNHLLKSKKFWNRVPKSASLSIIEYARGRAKIKLFNDVTHLEKNE